MTIAFDLDGTLFEHAGNGPNYGDVAQLARSTRPMADRCWAVRRIIEAGGRVDFVTGRGKVHRKHTLEALRRHVHPIVGPGQLHMQEVWTTYEAMAQFKAAVLNELGSTLYVGDHWADRQAAFLAGIVYHDHHAYFGPRLVLA